MIRPATRQDTAAVTALIVAAELFPPNQTEPVEQMLAAYFSGAASEGHGYVVDTDHGDLVGMAYYQPKPAADRVWDLTMIAVAPDRQGQGRGGALLRYVEDALEAEGQRLLLVETSGLPRYDLTRAFYAKCGYDQVARIGDYWEPGDDLVLFRKSLS